MAGEDEIHLKPAALIALMLALFGGNAALTNWSTRPEAVRPDPFSGSEGRALEARVQREIDNNSRRIDALRSDINLCLAKMHDKD